MRLAVVAATGGIGRHVLDQALAAGHRVTALVRTPRNVHRDVPSLALDLTHDAVASDVLMALAETDAVISCLGPRHCDESGIVAPGTRVLAEAMRTTGSHRLVVVTGAGVSIVPTPSIPQPPRREPGAGWWNQYVATTLAVALLGEHFVDVAHAEHELRLAGDQGLSWTALRAPFLTDGPLTERYRTTIGHSVPRGVRLSRADTAHALLEAVEDPRTFRTAVAAAY